MTASRHLTEEEVDEYSLGRLSDSVTEQAEIHLLICEHCRNRVTITDALRVALRRDEAGCN